LPAGALALLTAREAEVLGLLCEHKSYKEIADGLSISPLTVKRHLNGVYAKLGVRTGREAVRVATKRGWCSGG
jgi:LuxR family maltose regulon positive regulatory protein